jgi:hypothetical protein
LDGFMTNEWIHASCYKRKQAFPYKTLLSCLLLFVPQASFVCWRLIPRLQAGCGITHLTASKGLTHVSLEWLSSDRIILVAGCERQGGIAGIQSRVSFIVSHRGFPNVLSTSYLLTTLDFSLCFFTYTLPFQPLLFGTQLSRYTLTVRSIVSLSSVAPGSLYSGYRSGIAPKKSSTNVRTNTLKRGFSAASPNNRLKTTLQ